MVSRPSTDGTTRGRSFRAALLRAAGDLGLALDADQADALQIHYRLLREWGRKINLTGLKDEESILRRHFLEPIAAAGLIGGQGRLVDLRSGDGLPARSPPVLRRGLALGLGSGSGRETALL